MDVSFDLIDWTEALARAEKGTLASCFGYDENEDNHAGLFTPLDYHDTLSTIFALGAACDAVIPKCSESNCEALKKSFGRFMTEASSQWNDLPVEVDPEYVWLALSPESVGELLSGISKIDFEDLGNHYEQSCPDDTKEDLSDLSCDFVESLQEWAKVFSKADESGMGLVVSVG